MFHTGKFNKIPLRKRSSKTEIDQVPKLPKLQLPKNFETNLSDPLYSLPKELLLFTVEQKGKPTAPLRNVKTKRHEKLMQTHAASRKAREDFRQKLVRLIVQDDSSGSTSDTFSAYERKLLRYYYYLKQGIETVHVAPLDRKILLRIHNLLSPKLKKWNKILAKETEDMKEDFMMSMKKAVVDFALRDPTLIESFEENITSDRLELKNRDVLWYQRVQNSKQFLEKNLHSINPCIAQVLEIWWKQFNDLRLIRIQDIVNSREAYDIAEFKMICQEHIETAIDLLNSQWLPTIQNIFLQGSKKKLIPKTNQPKKMKRFYDCLSCIMTYNLQTLCLKSIAEYTHYLLDIGGINQGFFINVLFKNSIIAFEPPFKKGKEVLLETYSALIDACKAIPRLETLLYQDYTDDIICLKPVIDMDYILECKREVHELLEDQRIGPELRIQDFDDYIALINGETKVEVNNFLKADPPKKFEEYCKLSVKFVEMASDIPMKLQEVVVVGMYKMRRGDLMDALQNAAISFANQLLERMTMDYQAKIKEFGEEYLNISNALLTAPLNTAALMELIKYSVEVEEKILVEMEGRLQQVMKYITFLSDYTTFTPLEMKANNNTFQWYARMPNVLEECRQICQEKTLEYQEALKVRITKFISELSVMTRQVEELQHWGDLEQLEKYVTRATALFDKLSLALTKIDQFNEEEESFEWELSQYPLRKQISDKLMPYKKLYDSAYEFLNKYHNWMSSKVGSFEPDEIESDVAQYYKAVYKSEKTFVDVPEARRLANDIRVKIEDFKEHLPIVQTLGNPGMKIRHWEKVSEIVGFPITIDETLTLEKIIDYGLTEYILKFELISEAATKENTLERNLDKMMSEWEDLVFKILAYRDSGTYILSEVEDIQILLDDHIVKTQTMKNSPYIKPFETIILAWEAKLQLLQEIMDEWLHVQMTWMYLEPIFSSPDIQQQMPEESRRFSAVDKMWREIMKAVFAEPRVLDVIEIEKMLERLKKSNSLLEVIQHGLNAYLEKKRLYFPRFFFLSNDELLEILSETKDPTRVQPHLKKCFEGIALLSFTEDLFITHIKSSEGEIVPLVETVNTVIARGQVEKWLLDLEKSMKKSVHSAVSQAFDAYLTTKRDVWVLEWAGQTVQCIAMTFWTSEVTKAIQTGDDAKQNYLETCNNQISDIVSLVRGKLSTQNRITLGALIVLDVHARDVLSSIIDLDVQSINDFNWICHIRYYFEQNEDEEMHIFIRMISSQLIYGYEYLGNTLRLVVTPLTDRCFRTLFEALHLNLGGAPEGPAGTGKTETTKDLAKAIAKQCVVFNCSDGLDYIALGKFFKGLASCGAWSCFDEFNRIDLEVLSVVAQQIMTIQRGLVAGATELMFEGTELHLDKSCAVFITMNPGYAGRSELPDNLKALFRSVAMMVPDYVLISEIELYASGYLNAKALAVKIVATYKLCSEQLSSQSHYDYGMRAVKSVLRAAAALKLRYPDEKEEIIVHRSINDINLPKFLDQDVPLFKGILSDLFPGLQMPETGLVHLVACFHEACKLMNLQSTPFVVEKAMQIYEMMLIRHGLMIVGHPFSGKTSTYKALAKSLKLVSEKGLMPENNVAITVINPKSITMGQLYGQFDAISHEWSDGILAVSYRNFATSTTPDRKWLVFDGPIDAIWIENLNTVLDDNKKLCLMSGEIIQLAPTTNLIFEPMDLEAASPATVSRCGMIYMEPSGLGWHPLVESWLKTLPASLTEGNHQIIRQLFHRFCPPLLWLLNQTNVNQMYKPSKSNLVWACMNLFDSFMDDYLDEKYVTAQPELDIRAQLEGVFFFSAIWSLGATLEMSSRPKFDSMFRGLLEKEFPQATIEKFAYPYQINKPEKNYIFAIPKDGLVFDYRYIKEGKGKWKPWSDDLSSALPIPRDIPAHSIIVTTLDTIRYLALFKLLVYHKKGIMMVGPTGTGKSSYIRDFLVKKADTKLYKALLMGFSAQTSANQTQEIIMSKLDKRKKGVFGSSIGTQCVVFIDDVSMPQAEVYGAQPPIELLRQALDQGLWYNHKENTAMRLIDIQFMCAMSKPIPGTKEITPRFTRHFGCLCIDEFDDDTLMVIFSKIMLWHLDTRGFSKEFDPCIEEIVSATLDVYKNCRLNLLPTPAKSHYTFNLRDFSRVIQGVLLSVPEVIEDLLAMKRLWIHECLRVFGDRLIDSVDKEWFIDALRKSTSKRLHEDFDKILEKYAEKPGEKLTEYDLGKLVYCDFANPKADTRHYMEVTEMDHLTKTVDSFLFEFNNMTKKPMNLVLFRFAVEHVSRICRIVSQPRSHALLIGLGGSGRQSLTRLSAHINDYELFQVEMSKQYKYNEWREDLKTLFKKASVPDQHVIFLFNESQIKDECFLEDINNMLNSGEVQNLFNNDEKAEILERMRVIDKQKDKSLQTDGTVPALQGLFVDIVREQLHIVLVMSPAGTSLRTRIRKFPALVNCCTIDWFQEWPQDALLAVATQFLKDMELTDAERKSTIDMCQTFHVNIQELSKHYFIRLKRHNYVTPTAYLELISLFKTLLNSKRKNVLANKKRYVVGLEQLETAAKSVGALQTALEVLQPKLAAGAAAVAATSEQVVREKEGVALVEENVLKDQEDADEQAKAAQAIKEECDADLAEAMPIMESALAALNTLTPADITFIKSMKNPPKGIKLVMEAICIVKSVKPDRVPNPSGVGMVNDYWGPSKKLLNDIKFLESLLLFDKDNIPPQVIEKLTTTILTDELFVPDKMKQASLAAEGLCKWVFAIVKYDGVAKIVGPKKKALAEAQAIYNNAMAALGVKQAELKEIRDKLEALEEALAEQNRQQKQLDDEVELCGNKLARAEQLLKGLGGEKSRWEEAVKELEDSYGLLIGNILISAGIIAYLGPFTTLLRETQIKEWISLAEKYDLSTSQNFKLSNVLGDPVTIQQWNLDGLPTDDFSIESALIIKSSRRWSLMIDPQSQANSWIKKMEKPFHLNIIRMTQADFARVLENAVQFGQPVLLENVGEELDPMLEPLLQQQTFKQGGATYIKLGENVIEYNANFRFYITTKLRNPHYMPEISVRVTLVNFMLGTEGLISQLLAQVVAQERPELQQAKADLTSQSAEHRKILKEIEEKILTVLSSSDTLLEDEAAVQILNSSKMTSDEIIEKQTVALETEIQIDKTRKQYEPIAVYSTVLFYLLDDLSSIDPMYMYSLRWFQSLYSTTIDNTEKVDDISLRLKDLKEHFTYSIYTNVCQSLFEKDKLVFSLLLTVSIMKHENKIEMSELIFLLTGGQAKNIPLCSLNFLSSQSWGELNKLNEYNSFKGIVKSFEDHKDQWEEYINRPDPQAYSFPSPWDTKISPFQSLLIMRVIRKDKMVPAIRIFVEKIMGIKYVEPPLFNLASSFANSHSCLPLLFILTPGADPMGTLFKFADDQGFGQTRLFSLSLGQGQGPIAVKLIDEGLKTGSWVILQNCHLAKSWMPMLEKVCEGFQPESTHPDFRLWLTSYPAEYFPVYVLQNCVKMTNEPPEGLRTNILRSYQSDPICEGQWFNGNNQDENFKKLLYSLCFFHAVVQERKKFGPLGWNIPYEFNETDLRISLKQLNNFLNEYEDIQYEALKYLTGECNYGGRVTDEWDRRCLKTVLKKFYNPDVLSQTNYAFETTGTYFIPTAKEHSEFIAFIRTLPINTLPAVFGMNENADITKHYRETDQFLDTTALTQDRTESMMSGAVDLPPEEQAMKIAEEVLNKLPEKVLKGDCYEDETDMSKMSPLLIVLRQEADRYTKLLNIIKTSLKSVISAVQGYSVLTEVTEDVLMSIVKGKIPSYWGSNSYPSLKPFSSYITDFLERLNFLQEWNLKGPPAVFWLSGFYFPQAFLTAVQQSYARKYCIPIDQLAFDFKVEEDEKLVKPEEGAYIKGLFIEGARWNRHKHIIDEAFPKELYDNFPIVWLIPMKKTDLSEGIFYDCPLYKTNDRRGILSTTGHSTNYILYITLPTEKEPDHWIMRGVALLSQLPF